MMIAPEHRPTAFLTGGITGPLPKPIPIPVEYEEHTPAQTLADLSRRCGRGRGCPYTLDQLLGVLAALRYHGRAEAGQLATDAELPASATYGCLLETEDCGLSRRIPAPVHLADHQTAEITATGLRFLREIEHGGSVQCHITTLFGAIHSRR